MRISAVETRIAGNTRKDWLFVRVGTDDGLHGYGEGPSTRSRTREIVDRPIRPVDGDVEIPDAPGLGIELDWDRLGGHPYRRQHLIRLFSPGWERRDGAPDPAE